MPQINDVEMQYRAAEAMQAQQMPSNAATPQEQREGATEQKMSLRGGGLLIDLCACFLCCECMEACCHGIEDCLCCCC